MIQVGSGKTDAVHIVTATFVYSLSGDAHNVCDVPAETTKAVDDFVVLKRSQREGVRDVLLVYSGHLYVSVSVVCSRLSPSL